MNQSKCLFVAAMLLSAACERGGSTPPSNTNGSGGSTASAVSRPIIYDEDMTAGLTQQSPIKTTHSKLRRSMMETAVCRTSYRLLSKGIDASNNGIRDDIDRLIAQKFAATPALKKSAEQKARALQRSMEATTRQQSIMAGDEIMRATACVSQVLSTPTADKLSDTIWCTSKPVAFLRAGSSSLRGRPHDAP